MEKKTVYDSPVYDARALGTPKMLVLGLQHMFAMFGATVLVPALTGLDVATTLLFAGLGTLLFHLITKKKVPAFLGSSFAFIGSMCSAFAGASTMALGYLGLIVGAALAGLVYVVLAILAKKLGTDWLNKLMPPVVIGPTVAIIGLSLAPNAVGDFTNGAGGSTYVAMVCGLVTLLTTVLVAAYAKKMARLIPFILGILAGYACACVFFLIGEIAGCDELKVISFQPFVNIFSKIRLSSFLDVPRFTFWEGKGAFSAMSFGYFVTLLTAYVPVAFVVFAEHIADHKNLSSIVEQDLLKEPGLHRTLLGDGVGSVVGAFFGGCPNTTYGESIGCVAITGNASIVTIWYAAVLCILISFLSPFIAFLQSIPSCVMGGVCIALYGFIAVSGLKMLQGVDLNENRNLFTASVILITGVGGLVLKIGAVEIRTVACALILGILVNKLLGKEKANR